MPARHGHRLGTAARPRAQRARPDRHARAGRRLRGRAPCPARARRGIRGHRAPAAGAQHMIRVLLADDQALIRAGFRALLEHAGDITVVGAATDRGQGVSLAATTQPDVVLMDIRMPGTDGIEATRRIADRGDLAGVRVLILTTFESDAYIYEAMP